MTTINVQILFITLSRIFTSVKVADLQAVFCLLGLKTVHKSFQKKPFQIKVFHQSLHCMQKSAHKSVFLRLVQILPYSTIQLQVQLQVIV